MLFCLFQLRSVKLRSAVWIETVVYVDFVINLPVFTLTLISYCRWSGCVITAESSRRSWRSQANGSPVRLESPLASPQCAKRPRTRNSGLAPKHQLAPQLQAKTPADLVHLVPQLVPTHGHVANRQETRKMDYFSGSGAFLRDTWGQETNRIE